MLSRLPKFRPEFGDAPIESDVVLLQRMKQARTPETFGRGPEEDNRVGGPRLFALGIAESTVQFHERFSVLPNRNSGAEFAELREIVVE